MGALTVRQRAAAQINRRTEQIRKYKSPASAAGNMAIAGTGAALGGAADVLIDDGVGDMLGAASIVAGFFLKRSEMVYGGAGALMHRARSLGISTAESFSGDGKK